MAKRLSKIVGKRNTLRKKAVTAGSAAGKKANVQTKNVNQESNSVYNKHMKTASGIGGMLEAEKKAKKSVKGYKGN